MVDNSSQIVTDSKEEMVKKMNKCAAKKKERLAKLCALIKCFLFSYPKSSLFLSPRSMSAFVPTSLSYLGSPIIFLSSHMPAPAAISRNGISALMLPLSVFGQPLLFGSLSLRTFKQSLLDKPRPRMLTSPAKLFCLFPTFGALNLDNKNGLYNLINHNKRKWDFDIAFINSCPLAGNHDQKEVDLSFIGCKCPAAVKLN